MNKLEDLKQELQILTARRDRVHQTLYDIEKRINEIVKELNKLKAKSK